MTANTSKTVRLTTGAVSLACVWLLAACSSSSGSKPSKTPNTTAAAASTSASPTPTADPNEAACTEVSSYVTDTVKPTFSSWKPNTNEFDMKVGNELRDEGTHLYGLAGKTTGSVSTAITDEAKALINISIAIEAMDDTNLGTAADAANTALATLRGACNF